jgi:type I restriction enzyme, S subunit
MSQHISSKQISDIKIPLPPLPEQERIVCLLDEAEALRAARVRANARMEQFVPALFHEMFGEREYPAPFLRDIAEVVSGVAKGRRLGNAAMIVPYIRVSNVQAGYLDLREIKTIEAMPSEVEELRLKKGDVLLTEGGDLTNLGAAHCLKPIYQKTVFIKIMYFACALILTNWNRSILLITCKPMKQKPIS